MDKAEKRRWMYCRWIYRLGLYALASPFALYYGPNYFIYGTWTIPKPYGIDDPIEYDVYGGVGKWVYPDSGVSGRNPVPPVESAPSSK